MNGAYDLPFQMTDAESVVITLSIVDEVLPSEYDWFYAIKGCQDLSLTEANGIAIDDGEKTVTINPGSDYRLRAGAYTHGLLSINKVTGQAVQVFDGAGTVTASPNA